MRLKTIPAVEDFKKAIDNCKGDVWLESDCGNVRLNLKSILSQYVAIGKLIEEHMPELELYCAKPSDEKNFYEFFEANPDSL